jgi:hypothetical protein
MAARSQADRKQDEARTVSRLGWAIGASSLGLTGVLTVVSATQVSAEAPFHQPVRAARVANYETAPLPVTEVVVEVPVPSPLPPTHVPTSATHRQTAAGAVGAGAAPAAVVHSSVAAPAATPLPVPTAVSTGSIPH